MNGTVLCVDDDRNLCQILARALGEEGYEVHTAFDGDEALALVQETAFDLVLLNLILPRRDGFTVMESIRGLDGPVSATPVLVLSGCTPTPAYRERADALGAVDMLTKPVPLATLVEAVSRAVATSKREVPVECDGEAAERAPAPRRTSGAPQGRLERVPFPALLHHLHGLRANGVLHVESGKKRKWIQLRDGHPVAVRSNLMNECLGHYLVRTGLIQQADLDESRKQMRNGRLQGEILVAMEVLTEEEIASALRDQADEKLFEIFSWKQGGFRFEKGAVLSRANKIGVRRSPANLILLGVRTRFSQELITAYIRSRMDCLVVPGNSPYYRFQEIDLEPEHEAILRDLDGTRRVREIIAKDSDQTLVRTLYALVATGLLELKRENDAGAPAAVPRRAARVVSTADDEAKQSSLKAMAERYSAQTYFEILGVGTDADDSQIQQAFVTLAEHSHPDLYADSSDAVREVAEEVFAHITRAYDALRDSRSRSLYLLDMRREERAAAQAEKGQRALEAASEFQRGEAQLAARAYEDALAHFGRALELNPDEGDYHTHYGWTLHLCHPSESTMIEEAIEHVRRGLKLASHADRAYLYMGRLLRAIGKPAAAERMFTRAVQIEPDCVEALRELRLINMRRERSKGLIRRMLRR